MIAIVDYSIGNVRSLENAFRHLGHDVVVTSKPEEIQTADRIVLPGVGAFNQGIENLYNLNLVEILNNKVIKQNTPFLGICLGMQLLATTGHENGRNSGLGWISGECIKIDTGDNKLKLPHVGWNDIQIKNRTEFFSGVNPTPCYYFSHSFHIICDAKYILATCDYGTIFPCAIQKDNIFAVQFHPEKSYDDGLKLLENFCSIQ